MFDRNIITLSIKNITQRHDLESTDGVLQYYILCPTTFEVFELIGLTCRYVTTIYSDHNAQNEIYD